MPAPTRTYTEEDLTHPYHPSRHFKASNTGQATDFFSTDKIMIGLLLFLMVAL